MRCAASSNTPVAACAPDRNARCVAWATRSSGARERLVEHAPGHRVLPARAQQPGVERAGGRRVEVLAGHVGTERERVPVLAGAHRCADLAHLGVGIVRQRRARRRRGQRPRAEQQQRPAADACRAAQGSRVMRGSCNAASPRLYGAPGAL